MSTPINSTPAPAYAADFATPSDLFVAPENAPPPITPDNPPWGVGAAVLVWLGSVGVMFLMQMIATIIYMAVRLRGATFADLQASLLKDPTFIFVSIISIVPAHLLTLLLVWGLVTSFGKRPFRPTVGWNWGGGLGFWSCAGIAVLLWLFGVALTSTLGGGKTDLDEIVASSRAARYAVAFMATLSAPIVEECVYRGVLYPALQRRIGMLWSVVGVSALFALVHVMQYRNNLGVIAAVSVLSLTLTLVRARTGRLLPCFVIHLVFNGITCVLLLAEPYYRQLVPNAEPTGLLLPAAVRLFLPLA